MNFLVPLYLLGAAAVAIPIYLHLRRKPPKDTVEFSSLMFLRPTRHQPIKRRSQIENLPLLLLRCLALLLLAGMFARPFLRGGDKEIGEGRMRTVLLLDTSASMRRDGVWDAALRQARELIDKTEPDGALAVMASDSATRTLVSFADWERTEVTRRKETARSALESLQPGWGGSDLGSGLIAAAELATDASGGEELQRPARIVVISDLQRGASLEAVAEASWPAELSVELLPVEAANETNAALAAAPSPDPARPMIRVRNAAASEETSFQVQAGAATLNAVVPAGESTVLQLDEAVSEVILQGDGQDFDNRLFLAPREPAEVTLQFIGSGMPDDSNGPEYYFRRAFGLSDVLRPRFVDDLAEEPAILAIARELGEDEAGAIHRRLEDGGHALLVVTSTGMAETLGRLVGTGRPPVLGESDNRYALLENIDFDHPALREFRDPRWRDFTEVHFWKHRVLDADELPGSRILASFDNGDPAWIEVPVGRGSLLVMLSGWHPRDSQLALSTKFLPLLFSIFADHGPQVGGVRQFFVDEPLPLEPAERTVTLPSGETRQLAADESFRPDIPGIYRAGTGERTRSFAVNLRPSESELEPLNAAALAALGVPVEGRGLEALALSEDGKRRLRDGEAEANQNLWRWAVVLLLTLLVVESLIATRTGRANLPPEGATT